MTESLEEIQNRLKNLKDEAGISELTNQSSTENEKEKNDLGRAYEFIFTPLVCGAMGYGIDSLFSTRPLFLITLTILGLLAGFWAIYKASQNIATPLDLKRLQDSKKNAKQSANFETSEKAETDLTKEE